MAPSQVELGYWAFKCLKCLSRTPNGQPHRGIAQDQLDFHYQQVHNSGTPVEGYWELREEEYANRPYQGEGFISLVDTARGMSGVKARQLPNNTPVCQVSDSEEMTGQLSSKIVLQCESCSFKTSQLKPSKARQRLAAHVASHSKDQKDPMGPTDVQEGAG